MARGASMSDTDKMKKMAADAKKRLTSKKRIQKPHRFYGAVSFIFS